MKNDATKALVEGTNVLSREEFETLRPDQQSGVRRLLHEIIVESDITDDAEIDRYLSTALRETHIVVRVSGGEIVSVCTLHALGRIQTTLSFLGTDASHRRQGHAREMLKDVIDFLIREQLAGIITTDGHTELSRDLYPQLGFTGKESPTMFLSQVGGAKITSPAKLDEVITYEITERHITDDWEGLLENAIDLVLDQWQAKGFNSPLGRDFAREFLEGVILTDGARVYMDYIEGNDVYEQIRVEFWESLQNGHTWKADQFFVERDAKTVGKIRSMGLMRRSKAILSANFDGSDCWRAFHYN